MNYIKKLETENLDLKKNQAETSEQITDLLKYLSSDKFAGFENNFVNATEMRLRLTEILNNINC